MMNTWDEVLAENESDAECQLGEQCKCGVTLRDHYNILGLWKPCDQVSSQDQD